MNIYSCFRFYVFVVNSCSYHLTYPAVCALPLDPLPWYNGYVKRGKGKSMKNAQLQKYERMFVEQVFGGALSSAMMRSIGVLAVTPRVP